MSTTAPLDDVLAKITTDRLVLTLSKQLAARVENLESRGQDSQEVGKRYLLRFQSPIHSQQGNLPHMGPQQMKVRFQIPVDFAKYAMFVGAHRMGIGLSRGLAKLLS
jgi:hypothetical protein